MIIAESDSKKFGEIAVDKDENDNYNVFVDGKLVQPNHNADAVIRYLCHILQNT